MKDKVTVGTGAGLAGWLVGAANKPEHIAAVGIWFNANFGSVGFISFFFNIIFILMLVFVVDYFSKRDDQKRSDVLALVGRVEKLVADSHAGMDKFKDSIHQLQLAFAAGGLLARVSEKNTGSGTGG